jgi:hypothetical protein
MAHMTCLLLTLQLQTLPTTDHRLALPGKRRVCFCMARVPMCRRFHMYISELSFGHWHTIAGLWAFRPPLGRVQFAYEPSLGFVYRF